MMRKKPTSWRKTCLRTTLPNTNPTWTDQTSQLGLWSERL